MFRQIRELFLLLTDDQKKRFYKIQILVIFMAFAEVVGITSIGPFMALVGDISLLDKGNMLARVYQLSGLSNPYDFLFATGITVLSLLAAASLISMVASWRLSLFAFKVGTEISDRLYRHYLAQNWLFHSSGSSANLTKQVSTESIRVTAQVILPLMHMNARIALATSILLGMFIYNPMVAIVGIIIFFSAYFILFKVVKKRLNQNGINISSMSTKRFRLMNEGFGGIRDILLLNRSKYFVKSFEDNGSILARACGVNNALTFVPRYLMELLAFGSMIALILFLIKNNQGDLGKVLPALAIYGLAGFKLLPALQQIYASIAEIRGNISAFEAIKTDLIQSKESCSSKETIVEESLAPKECINLKDINFTYPGKNKPALNNLNINIPANNFVGLVGPSGAGKSTVIDVLLGLINADSGVVFIDDKAIDDKNCRSWQNSIGFVPQSIFLSEGTVAENVAFGIPDEDIDYEQVSKVIKLARLEELVTQLPLGLKTKIGERGVQLSGGQRQRIGIARALFNEASVLVFDEATSSLDGITEKLIMDAIHDLSGQKTIIMIAHRLKTVEKCNLIFYLDNGSVKNKGTYEQLLKSDVNFKKMAEHA